MSYKHLQMAFIPINYSMILLRLIRNDAALKSLHVTVPYIP